MNNHAIPEVWVSSFLSFVENKFFTTLNWAEGSSEILPESQLKNGRRCKGNFLGTSGLCGEEAAAKQEMRIILRTLSGPGSPLQWRCCNQIINTPPPASDAVSDKAIFGSATISRGAICPKFSCAFSKYLPCPYSGLSL